jgi:ribose 5-phosphate isomerase A
MSLAQEKKNAALRAVNYVHSGMTLGLGTGSTAFFAIEAIGESYRAGTLRDIRAVATSETTALQARQYNLPLLKLEDVDQIDLTIDGADEFDPQLRLIKGGGGALFREKLVAFASRRVVIISDASKQVAQLGAYPLPVEVFPGALNLVLRTLNERGYQPQLRLTDRQTTFVTDNHNYLLDLHLGAIPDPEQLDAELHLIPGLLETGLFLGLAHQVIMGQGEGVVILER